MSGLEFGIEPVPQNYEGKGFVGEFPIGTLVVDTSVFYTSDLSHPFGWTSEGAIYTNPALREVNVRDINGVQGASGTWSIAFLQKGKLI